MTMKKRLISIFFAVALAMGMVPAVALAADPIVTDVVIHKLNVPSGTSLQDHDGNVIASGDLPAGAVAVEGVEFAYWKIGDSATEAQLNALKTLTTIEAIEAWIANNSGVLTNKTVAGKTAADGSLTVAGLAEGKYFFAETNGPDFNVTEYIGVPFLLELPVMKTDGSGYFGQGTNALHVYPKNASNNPGLDVETVDAKTGDRIGTATFDIMLNNATIETININKFTTLTDLASGNYQLVNTAAPDGYILDNRPVGFTVSAGGVTFDDPNSPMASWTEAANTSTGNPMITVKFVKKPDVGKTVEDENGNGQATGSAQVGDTVTWKITAEIPTNIEEYLTFALTDKLDSRLDFGGLNTVKVTVSNGTMTESTHYTKAYNNAQHATVPHALVVTFDPKKLETLAGETITVTFDTVINSSAIIGQPIPNDFDLEFDNGYGGTGTLKPPVPPTVWTGGYKFKKYTTIDGKEQLLEGAEFKITLTKGGSDYLKWTDELIAINSKAEYGLAFKAPMRAGEDIVMVSGSNGILGIMGLEGGTYYLVETKAPTFNGKQYNLLRDPVEFTVTETSHLENNIMGVENKTGFQIPQTGGIGTVIFTVVGVALMGLAIALFRRRKIHPSSEE